MSERLKARLIERIRARGPLTFAEYMTAALYDPADGFFAGSPVGEHAHFVTSPHVSGVFSTLVATMLAEVWETLGRPSPFVVVEVGAGDGTLGAGVTQAARGTEWGPRLRYVCVEQSPVARGAIAARGLESAPAVEVAVGGAFVGCIIANELLDNLPFHRLRGRDGRVVEVYVDERDGTLVETEGPPVDEALAAVGAPVTDGTEQPSSPAARALVASWARSLERGYIVAFDYGFVAGQIPGPVRGYRGQKLVVDLLADPGSCDVTGPVDFDAIAAAAAGAGLTVWGPATQRQSLMALGYRRAVEVLRSRQAELEAAGEWREAVAIWNERGQAAMLVDEQGLGGLRVLGAGTEGLPPPLALRVG